MHAAIAGLSSGVPTVAVGYSVKAEGIMADLNEMSDLKQGLLISIEDFLEPGLAGQSLHFAWENRLRISKQIQKNLPLVKERATSNFGFLLSALL
jgi:polysaccharide pyruvyl transferase WcaK-like protein